MPRQLVKRPEYVRRIVRALEVLLVVIVGLGVLTLIGFGVYAAVHFILKFW